MDEDNRSALLPCSSSDLERVAGTRLGTVESVVILWASVVWEVRLAIGSISRVDSVGVEEGSKSRLGVEWLEESIVAMRWQFNDKKWWQCDSESRDEFRMGTTTSKTRKCSKEVVDAVVGWREKEDVARVHSNWCASVLVPPAFSNSLHSIVFYLTTVRKKVLEFNTL